MVGEGLSLFERFESRGLENRALKQAHLEPMVLWKVALAQHLDEIKQGGQAREFEESKRGTANWSIILNHRWRV